MKNLIQTISQLAFMLILSVISLYAQAADFDQHHAAWNELLKTHVQMIENGHASRMNYAGLKTKTEKLEQYLSALSAVSATQYQQFNRNQQLAFMTNAYNAFTAKLILTQYPNVKSIKELGNFIQSPWKKNFFTLLGEPHNLDWIENEVLRKTGVFDEPRIHFAINCASIGCPRLLNEAYDADKIEPQLNLSMQQFLQDRQRNYYDQATNTLHLSKIFDWFGEDFIRHYGGLEKFISLQAAYLTESPTARDLLLQAKYKISYTEYDWNLNDSKSSAN